MTNLEPNISSRFSRGLEFSGQRRPPKGSHRSRIRPVPADAIFVSFKRIGTPQFAVNYFASLGYTLTLRRTRGPNLWHQLTNPSSSEGPQFERKTLRGIWLDWRELVAHILNIKEEVGTIAAYFKQAAAEERRRMTSALGDECGTRFGAYRSTNIPARVWYTGEYLPANWIDLGRQLANTEQVERYLQPFRPMIRTVIGRIVQQETQEAVSRQLQAALLQPSLTRQCARL